MISVAHELRYPLRLIRRRPAFSIITIVTLALGIGANTAVFSLLDALLLRSLPVYRPSQLVQLGAAYRQRSHLPFSLAIYKQLERNQRVFSDLFAWTPGSRDNVEINGLPFVGTVRGVSGNYYSGLGAFPALGRLIGPDDAREGAGTPVAVLGYEFWEREFGRDPSVIGRVIHVEGEAYTIVGVNRKWFMGMTPGAPVDVTIPITAKRFSQFATSRGALWLSITGRLKDGVSIEQAREQIRSFWRDALIASAPTATPGPRLDSFVKMGIDLDSAATGINRELRNRFDRPLRVLMALVIGILLVACVNLASLTLARSAVREREIAVRLSLGASRLDVIRQLLLEVVLLSVTGTLLALAVATTASHLLVTMIASGASTPILLDLRPDWRVFAFAAVAAVATAMLIGLAPAWHLSRQEPADALRSDGRTSGSGTSRFGKALIVSQIALSLVLVIGAGLLLRTFENLRNVDPQFERSKVLELSLQRGTNTSGNSDMSVYRQQILGELSATPGVISASFASIEVPQMDGGWKDTVSPTTELSADSTLAATLVVVSPEFFQTLGIPILEGRSFDWTDDEHHPRVAIVDSNLAQRLGNEIAVLGQQLRFGVQAEFQAMQCIGVARNARLIDVRDPSAAIVYVPLPQHPSYSTFGALYVRSRNPAQIERTVQQKVDSEGHEYTTRVTTLLESSNVALVEDRATTMLATIFGGLALLLAGIGLFGLMSYTVARRTREIGIRMALGSQRAQIRRLVLGESVLLIAIGLAIGIPCALAASRLLVHMLFGVTPSDPLTMLVSGAMLLIVGVAAGYYPARRATTVDPMTALRCE